MVNNLCKRSLISSKHMMPVFLVSVLVSHLTPNHTTLNNKYRCPIEIRTITNWVLRHTLTQASLSIWAPRCRGWRFWKRLQSTCKAPSPRHRVLGSSWQGTPWRTPYRFPLPSRVYRASWTRGHHSNSPHPATLGANYSGLLLAPPLPTPSSLPAPALCPTCWKKLRPRARWAPAPCAANWVTHTHTTTTIDDFFWFEPSYFQPQTM